jgi:hypothetical protein
LHDAVDRLHPVGGLLQQPGSVLVASSYNGELCGYLAKSVFSHCTSPAWPSLVVQISRRTTIESVLNDAHATVIYADSILEADPHLTRLLGSPTSFGWRRVAEGTGWSVLVRSASS